MRLVSHQGVRREFLSGEPPVKTPRKREEWKAQEIDWTFLQKALPYGALCRGIDQSAKRSRQANAARLRRGCLPGTPDTYILWNGITVWLERKKGKNGRLDPAQELFRDQVIANQGHWARVDRAEDVEMACVEAGIPLRATLGDIRTRIAEQNERLAPKAKRKSHPRASGPRFLAGKRLAAQMYKP